MVLGRLKTVDNHNVGGNKLLLNVTDYLVIVNHSERNTPNDFSAQTDRVRFLTIFLL